VDCWFEEQKKGLTLVDADPPVEVMAPQISFFLFLLLRFCSIHLGCFYFGVPCLVCRSPFPGSLRLLLFDALLFVLLDWRTAAQKHVGALQYWNLSSVLASSRTGVRKDGGLLVGGTEKEAHPCGCGPACGGDGSSITCFHVFASPVSFDSFRVFLFRSSLPCLLFPFPWILAAVWCTFVLVVGPGDC
jgi:hypothetical protein